MKPNYDDSGAGADAANPGMDAGRDGGTGRDAGARDAGTDALTPPDAFTEPDAGPPCEDPEYGECDGETPMCETYIWADEAHCGSCRESCEGERLCVAAECRVADIVDVGLGAGHTCVLTSSQHVLCWGRNSRGQLGDGTFGKIGETDREDAVAVVDLGDAIALDSEAYDTCVIRGAERVVDCWGDNRPEHFGPAIGARSLYARPESVRGVAGIPVLDVSVSGLHTCVRTADQILCAGVNIGGALGRADDTIRTNVLGPPEGLPDGLTPVSIAASGPGGFGHTCVAMSDGLVYCFGANDYGQCGQPSETFSIYVPSPVPDLTGAVFVGAGYYASCALDTSGRVYCWGDNSYGQLGDGTEEGESSTPLRVDGLPAIGQLAVGSNFVLAVSREGDEVWGWGDGSSGQLGLGETMLIETGTPRRLLTSASATYEAFAGTNHACVIERPAAGRARLLCAGSNFYGELGGFDGPLSATFERVNALP